MPALQNRRRQGRHPQQLHGAELIDHFHGPQGHPRRHCRQGQGQGHPQETAPGPHRQGAAHLLLAGATAAKGFAAQQHHIAVGAQGQDCNGPAKTANPQARAAAEVDQGSGQQVTGGGQGEQLGEPQPAAAGELAAGREPAVAGADQAAGAAHTQHQRQGVGQGNKALGIELQAGQRFPLAGDKGEGR